LVTVTGVNILARTAALVASIVAVTKL
jgi:hypothetical protein